MSKNPQWITKVIRTTIALFSCSVAFAAPEITDGNSLLRLCEAALKPEMARVDLLDRMYLMGYIKGFVDAHAGTTAYDIPPSVTTEQAVRVIKKWLEDHPKTLDQQAASLIDLSLRDAFPAKTQR